MKSSTRLFIAFGLAFFILGAAALVIVGFVLYNSSRTPRYVRADCDILTFRIDPLPGAASAPPAADIVSLLNARLNPTSPRIFSVQANSAGDIEIWIPKSLRNHPSANPATLIQAATNKGVLEFRIAPTTADTLSAGPLTQFYDAAVESLKTHGPATPYLSFRWFEIAPNSTSNFETPLITAKHNDRTFLFLHNHPDHILTQSPTPWQIKNAQLTNNSDGSLAVSFSLDKTATPLFAKLTADHLRQSMAIVLDERALSAPTIQSPILEGSGQISFGHPTTTRTPAMIRSEAATLASILDAGPLPAKLTPIPSKP